MYVAEAWRGRGIGEQLVREVIRRAESIPGLYNVVLGVTANQFAARRLYERAGFVAFGLEPQALQVDGVMVDECHMILRLKDASKGGL